MKKMNSGFTLIELVVVIVILGILAISVVPRVIDLTAESHQASVDGVAGAISSGMAVNFAGCVASNYTAGADCVAVDNCDDAASVLNSGALPAGFTVSAGATAAAGSTANCTVTKTVGATTYTADYTAIDTTP